VCLFWAIPAASFALGDLASSVLFVVGFLPQLREFVVSRDTSGYSFALTAIDFTGCLANVAVLFAPCRTTAVEALGHAAPFVAIMAMHCVLVLIAALVRCLGPRAVAKRDAAAVAPGGAA